MVVTHKPFRIYQKCVLSCFCGELHHGTNTHTMGIYRRQLDIIRLWVRRGASQSSVGYLLARMPNVSCGSQDQAIRTRILQLAVDRFPRRFFPFTQAIGGLSPNSPHFSCPLVLCRYFDPLRFAFFNRPHRHPCGSPHQSAGRKRRGCRGKDRRNYGVLNGISERHVHSICSFAMRSLDGWPGNG